jgi:hypothetical protein
MSFLPAGSFRFEGLDRRTAAKAGRIANEGIVWLFRAAAHNPGITFIDSHIARDADAPHGQGIDDEVPQRKVPSGWPYLYPGRVGRERGYTPEAHARRMA